MDKYLKLASCSRTLCWLRWSLKEIVNIGVPKGRVHIQCEECCVRLWVCNDCHLKHQSGERGVEVESGSQSVDRILLGNVPAITGQEAVVGESIHHRTGPTDCDLLDLLT